MKWETIIGLEVHVRLKTNSKLFSGAPNCYGAEPNSQACLIDLGMPGTLPVLNREAVIMAIKFGLAVNGQISKYSVFARKNYFYPDLPKGYQISQFDLPLITQGQITINTADNNINCLSNNKTINIFRAHLEEDAGKSFHDNNYGISSIDLNRAGTPLLEIVSNPDLRSAREAVIYMKKLHQLVLYIGICDGNMQEGSLRCDVNVSVRPNNQPEFGKRVEIKNLNSFKFIEKAIDFEVNRQIKLLEVGKVITQETRLYDSTTLSTRPMRNKENLQDYRYFPEPDLLPLVLSNHLIDKIRANLPELPDQKIKRFIQEYNLSYYDADILTSSRLLGDFYETTVKKLGKEPKLCANWITGDFLYFLNRDKISISDNPISPIKLSNLLERIIDGTISGKIAKDIFEIMWNNKDMDVDLIIQAKGLRQIVDNDYITELVNLVIENNLDKVIDYLSGKEKIIGFLIGKVIEKSGGKANPKQVAFIMKDRLIAYSQKR